MTPTAQTDFARLSPSRQRAIVREARAYCSANPHMADASIFWRGMSANQVRITYAASRDEAERAGAVHTDRASRPTETR